MSTLASIAIAGGVGALLAAGVGAQVGAGPAKRRAIDALRAACAARRALVLTYDDGPGPNFTPIVLDRLAASNARATFFLLGKRVPGAEAILDRIVREGHELGCHTERHLNAMKTWPWRAIRDIEDGYRTLSRWIAPNSPFRPPYGKVTVPTMLALSRRRAPLCFWTVDSRDTTRGALPDPATVVDEVRAAGGGVVLLHDFDRTSNAQERAKYVLTVTDQLLLAAEREGMQIMTMGQLLGLPTPRA